VKDNEFNKLLIKKLDELGAKIDSLIQVVAITSRRDGILKGKTKTAQIKILHDLGLSRDVIALIVGTTRDTVRARISDIGKKEKPKKKR